MRYKNSFWLGLNGLWGLVVVGLWLLSTRTTPFAAAAPDALTWQIDIIDATGDVGMFPSLALQPDTEKPYISYYHNTLGDLKLAFPVTSGGNCGPSHGWSCDSLTFQNNTNFGLESSLAFNSLGQWGIAYQNATDGTNEFRGIPSVGGGEIFFEPIEQPALIFNVINSLQYGANDVAQVSYGLMDINQSKGFIKHAKYVGQFGNCGYGLWRCTTVVQTSMTGFSLYNSMELLGNLPFIFYRDINLHLSMAVNTIGGCGPANDWDCTPVDATTTVNGLISSYTSEPDNFMGVAYIGNDSLRYAYMVASGTGNCGSTYFEFRCVVLDSVGTANNNQWMATSLGFFNGQPVIAYTDTNDRPSAILKIAYPQTNGNCGPLDLNLQYTWRCEVVDGSGSSGNDRGYYPSLQVDSQGRIHIAYYDYALGNLKYAVTEAPTNLMSVYVPLVVR